MAIVIDEYGGISGIVTLSDAISEIVGDIEDEYTHGDDEVWQVLGENHYETSGNAPLELLVQTFSLDLTDQTDAETIGGFLLELFSELPEQGEQIIYGSLLFTVKSLEDTKIGTVDILYSPADALQE